MDKDNHKELIWGKLKVQDLLRSLYKNKSFDQMSEQEINQMLDDLI